MKHVTVVICNYNYERYLAAAIDSALAQDYPATRVVVIDDGSTDGSRSIIEQYGSRISTIFKPNGGQVSAYNYAVGVLETEYVIFLDSDDMPVSEAVSEVMRFFASGDWAKVQFRLDVMDADGKQTGAYVPHTEPPEIAESYCWAAGCIRRRRRRETRMCRCVKEIFPFLKRT